MSFGNAFVGAALTGIVSSVLVSHEGNKKNVPLKEQPSIIIAGELSERDKGYLEWVFQKDCNATHDKKSNTLLITKDMIKRCDKVAQNIASKNNVDVVVNIPIGFTHNHFN